MTTVNFRFLSVLMALAAFVVFPACGQETTGQPVEYLPREALTIETAAGKDYVFEVEMALTGEQQARGLMHRTHMNSDAGMLFLFDGEGPRTFWMKDTLIPLDMIFIARDGTINHIHHSAKPQDKTHITSSHPAMAVLEINGGLSGTLGIKEGDKVIHKDFRNKID